MFIVPFPYMRRFQSRSNSKTSLPLASNHLISPVSVLYNSQVFFPLYQKYWLCSQLSFPVALYCKLSTRAPFINVYFMLLPSFTVLLFALLYGFIIHQLPEKSIDLLHKKARLILCRLTKRIFLYIIVYNSWAMAMPLRGAQSPVAPFLCQDVKSYGKEKYSVIQFSCSLIIHCFSGK